MTQPTGNQPPRRITDLIELKQQGVDITCQPEFEILPVDFRHQKSPFQAYIFLCRYKGAIGENVPFAFRKCYARGCPSNLCPHVSQAVMIANRYLQRDYNRLKQAGVVMAQKLFSLEDMTVKFDGCQEQYGPLLTVHDYITIAREGNDVSVGVSLELVPAVEHFARHDNAQTFLNGDFEFRTLGRTGHCQRCFACYATENEAEEKSVAYRVANRRLDILYDEFDAAGIAHTRRFFQ